MLILKPWNIVLIMFMIIGLVRSDISPGCRRASSVLTPARRLIDEIDRQRGRAAGVARQLELHRIVLVGSAAALVPSVPPLMLGPSLI